MNVSRRSLLIGVSSALLAGAVPAALAAVPRCEVCGGTAFGSYWRLTVPAGTDLGAARAAVEAIIARVDRQMSPFRSDSDLARFNGADSTDILAAPYPLRAVVGESLRIAALSGGAFDPTVGPQVNRFGFGPITGKRGGSHAGIELIEGGLRKAEAGLTLDLCGIAKGYALDAMVRALANLGHRSLLLEVGGEVYARGRHPEGRTWQLGIENPILDDGSMALVVQLEGMAIATSGDSVNVIEVGGRRYSHIIEPQAGRPVENAVASVSVLAPTAMEADALATALMVLGPERGAELAGRLGTPALFLLRDGGGLRTVPVGGFEAFMLSGGAST
jgi:FAD:protein FMN transferase